MNDLPRNVDTWWKPPAPKDKGDADPAQILQAIGQATVSWEALEMMLADIFRYFVESKSHAADRAYGAIVSSRARSEALGNSAEVYFRIHGVSKELQDEFKLLMTHVGKAAGRRNEIVHAITMQFVFGDCNDAGGVFLIPPRYNSRKTSAFKPDKGDRFSIFKSDYRYTALDIRFFNEKFDHLQQAAMRFLARLAAAHPQD